MSVFILLDLVEDDYFLFVCDFVCSDSLSVSLANLQLTGLIPFMTA